MTLILVQEGSDCLGQLITDLQLAMWVIETHGGAGIVMSLVSCLHRPHPHTAIVPVAMTNEVFTPDVSPGPSFAS